MLLERFKSSLIGSPLQRPAERLRDVINRWRHWRAPGLRDVLAEGHRTAELMRACVQDGTHCIDVGAHLGAMTHAFLLLSPSGRHMAIEPIAYKARWLRRKFPGVRVVAGAAGDTNGSISFEMIEGTGSADSGMKARDVGRPIHRVSVDCHRLDDLVPPDLPIGFIKMDVIGAELSVLRGARELIRRDRPVLLFECTQSSVKAMNVDPRALFAFVTEELGYDVYSLKGWTLQHAPLDDSRFLAAQIFPFEAFNFVGMPRALNVHQGAAISPSSAARNAA
jgi:FkbM family methyltransferase